MKKIIAILLLCCYTISSNGIFISKHFCGGQLQTISYYKKISKCCCDDGNKMAMDDDCCKDEATFCKLTTDQHLLVSTINLDANNLYLASIINTWQYKKFTFVTDLCAKQKVVIHPPPNICRPSLFIQYHCWKLDC